MNTRPLTFSKFAPVRLTPELDRIAREYPGGRSAAIRAALETFFAGRLNGGAEMESENATNH